MTEDRILKLFVENYNLKFSDIEKNLSIRSNKLAYYIKKLVHKKMLIKEKERYMLNKDYEEIIPYISDKRNVLPIILIKISKENKVYLYLRNKRPFKDKLGLPGGRLIPGESINQAVKRIMKHKFNVNANAKKINSISIEHVKKSGKVVHSFLLILVEATSKDKINMMSIENNKKRIISSDYKLLKDYQPSELKINTVYSKD